MAEALKTVVYRGGLVTFRIPETWLERYDPEGGGEFFEDGPDTPTLRLNVMTFRGPLTLESAAQVLEKRGRVERRTNDTALVRYDVPTEEAGQRLNLTRWDIAQPLPPDHLRLVAFTLTTLADQLDDPGVRQTIALLDAEVRAAQLALSLGEFSE